MPRMESPLGVTLGPGSEGFLRLCMQIWSVICLAGNVSGVVNFFLLSGRSFFGSCVQPYFKKLVGMLS